MGDRKEFEEVSSTLDSGVCMEDNMEFSDVPLDTLNLDYVNSVMDLVEAIPVEFEDTEMEMPEKVYEANANSKIEISQEDGTTEMLEVENLEGITEVRPIDEIGTWLKEINPNFDAFDIDSPYCHNCGSCAYAVYQ